MATSAKASFHHYHQHQGSSSVHPLTITPSWVTKAQRTPVLPIPMEYPSMSLPSRGPVSALFRGAFQHGFLSIFYAVGSKPLELWEKQLRAGTLLRVLDYEIRSQSLELNSNNVASTFITTPPGPYQSLGIRLPIIVLVLKNLKRYFLFEIQILDDTNTRRRFKVSNYHTGIKIRPFVCSIPMKLEDGWNQVALNLYEMTRKAFATGYVETIRVQVHANCRLRRIYFCEKVFGEEDVPAEFKTYVLGGRSNPSSEARIRRNSKSTSRSQLRIR